MAILHIYINRKRKSITATAKTNNIDMTKCDFEEYYEIEYKKWIDANCWIRKAEIISIACIYPTLILNAIFRIDKLNLYHILFACIPAHSLLSYLLIK